MAKMNIGFVRRGYSRSGGAEAYLHRLVQGILGAGHDATLFTNEQWPAEAWPTARIVRLRNQQPIAFADELEGLRPGQQCDLLFSLERIWRCHWFRAGDGVHRSWLARRAEQSSAWSRMTRGFNRKQAAILKLESALLGDHGAEHVIANSSMVREEIVQGYRYPREEIFVVANGVRVSDFAPAPNQRDAARSRLNLTPEKTVALFAGSGWERKGLRFAIAAVEELADPNMMLLVAGRGPEHKFRSPAVRFAGELDEIRLLLAAADIFILPTLYDPFSNASLEALAAGLPVITTRANGCSEIMEDQVHGSIVERAADINGLAAALRFWSEAERRHEAQAAILERAAEFDISRNITRTLELLTQSAASAAATSGKIRKT